MSQQMPPGFMPVGRHGGGKNAAGAYWYPSASHAYAAADHHDHQAWRAEHGSRYAEPEKKAEYLAQHAEHTATASEIRRHAESMSASLDEEHAQFEAHIPALRDATERYVAARAAHKAAIEAANKMLLDASEHLQVQQEIAQKLTYDFPHDVTPDHHDMPHDNDVHDGEFDLLDDWEHGDKHSDVESARSFLAAAEATQASAHAATRGKGLTMQQVADGPEEVDEEEQEEEEEDWDEPDAEDGDVPMSKAMRSLQREIAALHALFKGVKKGTKKKDNPEWERVGRTYRKKRSAADTHTVGRKGARDVQTLARHRDYAVDQDDHGFHVTHVPSRRHIATVDTLSTAQQLARDVAPFDPDHLQTRQSAYWAETRSQQKVAQRSKLDAAAAEHKQRREQATAASRASAKERRQQERDRAIERYRSHGYEPGREHPVSRQEPSASPSDLAQHIHGVLQAHPDEDFHPEWLQQSAARASNREVSLDDLQSALAELGNKARVRMTRAGHPIVNLRKAADRYVDGLHDEMSALERLLGGV